MSIGVDSEEGYITVNEPSKVLDDWGYGQPDIPEWSFYPIQPEGSLQAIIHIC